MVSKRSKSGKGRYRKLSDFDWVDFQDLIWEVFWMFLISRVPASCFLDHVILVWRSSCMLVLLGVDVLCVFRRALRMLKNLVAIDIAQGFVGEKSVKNVFGQ